MIVLNDQEIHLLVNYDALKIYLHPSMHYSLVRREARGGGRTGGLGWDGRGGVHRNKQGQRNSWGYKETHIFLNNCECQIFCIHNKSVWFSAICDKLTPNKFWFINT